MVLKRRKDVLEMCLKLYNIILKTRSCVFILYAKKFAMNYWLGKFTTYFYDTVVKGHSQQLIFAIYLHFSQYSWQTILQDIGYWYNVNVIYSCWKNK